MCSNRNRSASRWDPDTVPSLDLELDQEAHVSADLMIRSFPRKEVIQPHLPVRLPCYDFTPVT